MPYTAEQIKQLDNPYQELHTAESLAMHKTELDKLSPEEMKVLATKMLLACPNEDMNQFAKNFAELKKAESSFFTVLYEAHDIKMHIIALLNPKHPTPYSLLIGEEFSQDRFNKFNTLASELLKSNEAALAIRLALTTPPENRSSVAANVRNTFPKSECAQKVAAAFDLCRQMDRYLLSGQPQQFFSSKDYNPDLCREFSSLFFARIKNNEATIGKQLSLLKREEISKIYRQLEQLNIAAHDKENPIKLIVAAITIPEEKTVNSTHGVRNRYHFNNAASSSSKIPTATIAADLNTDAVENNTFCGLFKC